MQGSYPSTENHKVKKGFVTHGSQKENQKLQSNNIHQVINKLSAVSAFISVP